MLIYGKGKYAFGTTDAAFVIVAVPAVLAVVVAAALVGPVVVPPITPPMPVVVVSAAFVSVPVHVAPTGQQATLFARSLVQIAFCGQHAPRKFACVQAL